MSLNQHVQEMWVLSGMCCIWLLFVWAVDVQCNCCNTIITVNCCSAIASVQGSFCIEIIAIKCCFMQFNLEIPLLQYVLKCIKWILVSQFHNWETLWYFHKTHYGGDAASISDGIFQPETVEEICENNRCQRKEPGPGGRRKRKTVSSSDCSVW